MKIEVGIWIDSTQAVIVTSVDYVSRIKHITWAIEMDTEGTKPLDSASDSAGKITRDTQDKRYEGYFDRFFDEVIQYIRDADSMLLFGPDETKITFQKYLAGQALGERIVGVETIDQITDDQIVAKVQNYFWQLAKSEASSD